MVVYTPCSRHLAKLRWDLSRLLLLLSGLLFLGPARVIAFQPTVHGSWTLSGSVQFTPTFALNIRSDLGLGATLFGVTLTSKTTFTEGGYLRQGFTVDMPLGVFDIFSDLTFVPSVPRTDYWLTRMETSLAGVYMTLTFLVEHVAAFGEFGSGLELRLATEFPEHTALTITNEFGLEKNLAEVYGWTTGSGYDIVPRLNLHALTYTSTAIEVTGVKFGDYKLNATFVFTKAGFETCEFQAAFVAKTCPLRLDLTVTFTPTEKRVVVFPSVSVYGNCLKLYASVTPWALVPGSSTISGLVVNGFGWRCQLPSVVFSGLVGIADNLWRPRVAPSDIPLRAYNYIVGPDPLTAVHYLLTPYTAVFSWEFSGESYFAIDWYFGTDPSLFGISLVTLEWKSTAFDILTLSFGASFGSMGTTLSFSLTIAF